MTQMGRGALKARVTVAGTRVDLVTAHLKSKLLHFAGNRFAPRDEGERARYAGYALALRTAEAITLRHHATRCSRPTAARARRPRRPQRRAARGDDADPARPARVASSRPAASPGPTGRRPAAVEHRAAAARGPGVQPRLQRPRRADRPHPRQPHLAQRLESADTGTTDLPSIGTSRGATNPARTTRPCWRASPSSATGDRAGRARGRRPGGRLRRLAAVAAPIRRRHPRRQRAGHAVPDPRRQPSRCARAPTARLSCSRSRPPAPSRLKQQAPREEGVVRRRCICAVVDSVRGSGARCLLQGDRQLRARTKNTPGPAPVIRGRCGLWQRRAWGCVRFGNLELS